MFYFKKIIFYLKLKFVYFVFQKDSIISLSLTIRLKLKNNLNFVFDN